MSSSTSPLLTTTTTTLLLLLLTATLLLASSHPHRPIALPISKDPSTLHYTLTLLSPPIPLSLDVAGRHLSLKPRPSSTLRHVPRRSPLCASADPATHTTSPTCTILSRDPFTRTSTPSLLLEDTLHVSPTAASRLVYAQQAHAVAGLGRAHSSLLSQLSSSLSLPRQFSLCLPTLLTVGDDRPISDPLTYTPLLPSDDYSITLNAIRVNNVRVLLPITVSKARISTIDPYSVMETGVFEAVADAFESEFGRKRVAAVSPLSRCYEMGSGAVPEIGLVLQSEGVVWTMTEDNLMVEVGEGVVCLAIVDGGEGLDTPVVVGGYQLEDVLLHFDVGRARLGFSSALRLQGTSCSDLGSNASG